MTAVAAAVIIAGASPASAHDDYDDDNFTVAVQGTTAGAAPETYAGDTNATISIKVTNLAYQKLGSANVTVPAPFSLVSTSSGTIAGSVLQLRNLNLAKNAYVTVTITVDARTCAATTAPAFAITARKTADYSGSTSFTLKSPYDKQVNVTGTCGLAFVAQPTDAERNANITSEFVPSGAPITVEVRDAGNTGRATSSTAAVTLTASNPTVASPITVGNPSAIAVAGLASFVPGPTLSVSAFNYTVTASSPGMTSSLPSSKFAIADDQVSCAAGAACSTPATASNAGVTASATFGAGTTKTNLSVSINAVDAPVFECNNYPKGNSQVSQFGFSGNGGADRTGTFSVTIPNASWFVILYQVCWASPVDFYTKSGKLASAGTPDIGDGTLKPGSTTGETLKVGLLPNCKKWWWNDHWDWDDHWGFPNPTIETLPCITSRSYNWSTKALTIEVKTTGADPWRY
ncbi:MAG: hypothetical protein ABI658_04480 [Acidimicrobiales bacterium]